MFLLIHERNILNISCIFVVNAQKLTKQKNIMSLSGGDNVMVLKTIMMELSLFI